MSDSLETTEDMARPYVARPTPKATQVKPIQRAVQLLRESAQELALSVSFGDLPQWESEPEAKAAHDEALTIARYLETELQALLDDAMQVAVLAWRARTKERDQMEGLAFNLVDRLTKAGVARPDQRPGGAPT